MIEYTFIGLRDADFLKRTYPTFEMPPELVVENLKPGDLVQLSFLISSNIENSPAAERMWVRVISVVEDSYIGTLDNSPAYIQNLKIGDKITFEKRNIYKVIK